jgi:ribosomal protein L13
MNASKAVLTGKFKDKQKLERWKTKGRVEYNQPTKPKPVLGKGHCSW